MTKLLAVPVSEKVSDDVEPATVVRPHWCTHWHRQPQTGIT